MDIKRHNQDLRLQTSTQDIGTSPHQTSSTDPPPLQKISNTTDQDTLVKKGSIPHLEDVERSLPFPRVWITISKVSPCGHRMFSDIPSDSIVITHLSHTTSSTVKDQSATHLYRV